MTANAPLETPVLSGDGRVAAFASTATNLVPGDTNQAGDIYVRDLATGVTSRVSISNGEAQARGASHAPAVSRDGRFVAFISDAANLVPGDTNQDPDVFVRDRLLGTTERVSVDSNGRQAGTDPEAGPVEHRDVTISADGRYVAFSANAPELAPNDPNEEDDVYLHNQLTGTTTRVFSSEFWTGRLDEVEMSDDAQVIAVAAEGGSHRPTLSVTIIDQQGKTTKYPIPPYEPPNIAVSADGRVVAYTLWSDIRVVDVATHRDTSVAQGGAVSLSANGRLLSFKAFVDDGPSHFAVLDLNTKKVRTIATVSGSNPSTPFTSLSDDATRLAFPAEQGPVVWTATDQTQRRIDRSGQGDNAPPDRSHATHTYNTPGTYTAQTCVTDDDGATSCDETTVTVTGTDR